MQNGRKNTHIKIVLLDGNFSVSQEQHTSRPQSVPVCLSYKEDSLWQVTASWCICGELFVYSLKSNCIYDVFRVEGSYN